MKNPFKPALFIISLFAIPLFNIQLNGMEHVQKKEEKKEEEEEDNCSICYEALGNREAGLRERVLQKLECRNNANHWFHTDCIGRWIQGKHYPNCPLCRSNLSPEIQDRVLSAFNEREMRKQQSATNYPKCIHCEQDITPEQASENVYTEHRDNFFDFHHTEYRGKIHTECQQELNEQVREGIINLQRNNLKRKFENLKRFDDQDNQFQNNLNQFNDEFSQQNILAKLAYYAIGDSQEKQIHKNREDLYKNRARTIRKCCLCNDPATMIGNIRCEHCNHTYRFGAHQHCMNNILGQDLKCPVCEHDNANGGDNTRIEDNNNNGFFFGIRNFFIRNTKNIVQRATPLVFIAGLIGLIVMHKNNPTTDAPQNTD